MNHLFYDRYKIIKLRELIKIALSAIFISIGVVLPYLAGHMLFIPGNIFLLMHIPVFLSGAICGYKYGFFVGVLTPFLSSIITKMPSFYPMLPIMISELSIYGFAVGILVDRIRINIVFSLIIAMVLGRLFYALTFTLITLASATSLNVLTFSEAFIVGLPGIAIQLFIIPTTYQILRKGVLNKYLKLEKYISAAISKIANNECNLIIIKKRKVVFTGNESGVKVIFKLLKTASETLRGSLVIDKVIGKGAAIILIKAKVKAIYANLISAKAIEILKEYKIDYDYKEKTEYIINKTKTDMCPIEKEVLNCCDIDQGIELIEAKLRQLSNQV